LISSDSTHHRETDMARKKKVHIEMTPAVKLAADLLKLADKCNRYLAPKYDSAGLRAPLNAARESLSAAASLAQSLPEGWKSGKPLSVAQIEKKKKLLAKLKAELAAVEPQA
jgi:hypothetical protein